MIHLLKPLLALYLSTLIFFSHSNYDHTWILMIIYKIGENYRVSEARIEALEHMKSHDELREELVTILDKNKLWKSKSNIPLNSKLKNSENFKPKRINQVFSEIHDKFEHNIKAINSNKFLFSFSKHINNNALDYFDSDAANTYSKADFSVNNIDCRLSYTGTQGSLPGALPSSTEIVRIHPKRPKAFTSKPSRSQKKHSGKVSKSR